MIDSDFGGFSTKYNPISFTSVVSPFNKTQIMYKFNVYPGNNPESVKEALIRRGNFEEIATNQQENFEELHFIWKPTQFPSRMQNKIRSINSIRKSPIIINHIDTFQSILNKQGLYMNLKTYYMTNNDALLGKYKIEDSVPTTFLIDIGQANDDFVNFKKRFKELEGKNYKNEKMPSKHCLQNIWILKPSNQNQGRGIEIIKRLDEMTKSLENKPGKSKWIIQKYIEKPLLYKNRKFDIRIWVLLTDNCEIFMYKEGYIRTSSDNFTLASNYNFIHLTNNCLQKFSPSYSFFEEGNTISFAEFNEYLVNNYQKKLEFSIIPKIRDLIIDSILSARSEIPLGKRKYSFEFLGYDFMIDEDFRVWLIEVNVNPYIGIPNQFIAHLIPKMLDNLLEIVLGRRYHSNKVSKINNFQLIYCEKGTSFSLFPINLRSTFLPNQKPFEIIQSLNTIEMLNSSSSNRVNCLTKQSKLSNKAINPLLEELNDSLESKNTSIIEFTIHKICKHIESLRSSLTLNKRNIYLCLYRLSQENTIFETINKVRTIELLANCLKIPLESQGFKFAKIALEIFVHLSQDKYSNPILTDSYMLHTLFDFILKISITNSPILKSCCTLIIQFLKAGKNVIRESEEAYNFENVKYKMILHGLIFLFIYINTKNEELKEIISEHIENDYTFKELIHIKTLLIIFQKSLRKKRTLNNEESREEGSTKNNNFKDVQLIRDDYDQGLEKGIKLNLSMFFKKTLNFVDIYRELNQVIFKHYHKEDSESEKEKYNSQTNNFNKNYQIKIKTGINYVMRFGYSFVKNTKEFRIKNHQSLSEERNSFHRNMWRKLEHNLDKSNLSVNQTEKSLNEIKVFKKLI